MLRRFVLSLFCQEERSTVMKRFVLFALAAFMAACDNDPAGLCGGECPREIIVKYELSAGGFGHATASDGSPVWEPGDSLLLRIWVENNTAAATGILEIEIRGHAWRDANGSSFYQGDPSYHRIVTAALQPGERRLIEDTLDVAKYTLRTVADINVSVLENERPRSAIVIGKTSFPIRSSGFELELLSGPPLVPIVLFGNTYAGFEVRRSTPTALLMRLSNPYQMPLDSTHFWICMHDIDYCPTSYELAPTPRVAPGAETHVEFIFSANGGQRYDWWTSDETLIRLCPVTASVWSLCRSWAIRLVANFEADCDVQTIVPGVPIYDAIPECPKGLPQIDRRGSAFRFAARKGETYRATGGFIVSRDGYPRRSGLGESSQMTIPVDGTYYVVAVHRDPVTVTLQRVQ